jgi:hypothetical protein
MYVLTVCTVLVSSLPLGVRAFRFWLLRIAAVLVQSIYVLTNSFKSGFIGTLAIRNEFDDLHTYRRKRLNITRIEYVKTYLLVDRPDRSKFRISAASFSLACSPILI